MLITQCAGADMVHGTAGSVVCTFSCAMKLPAQVDLFHVRKDILIETAVGVKAFRPDHHAGTGSPEHRSFVIVLPVVLFHMIEHSAATERIAKAVDESAGGTGVLEEVPPAMRLYLWLYRGNVLVAVVQCPEGFQPPRRNLCVGIQQYIVVGLSVLKPPVVTAAKPKVFLQGNHLDRRESLCYLLN